MFCPRCEMQYGCSCSDWQAREWAGEVEPTPSDRRQREAEDFIENRRRQDEEPCNLNRG